MPSHFEPYLYLGDLTATSALIAWGGFWFEQTDATPPGSGGHLVDDERIGQVGPARQDSIGARSKPYGQAVVEVYGPEGEQVARATTRTTNHVWVDGLRPDTDYSYRVLVDGEVWAEGERRDWRPGPQGEAGLFPSGKSYDNRFRTAPAPQDAVPLTFAVLGDYGVGIQGLGDPARRQRQVAEALEFAVAQHDVRLVLTTGDNIYLGDSTEGGTGDEDDDWFFTYYQPYRYLLNRVPVYPVVGNHDVADSEESDDRDQLEDNFFLGERFRQERAANRSSLDPGLFYRFGHGADVLFVALDTSLATDLEEEHYFQSVKHVDFLAESLPEEQAGARPRWRFPFSHHPPFCAGPHHPNTAAMLEHLVPLFERSRTRVVFSGHEHNFQYTEHAGVHYFVTGAGGKLREGSPSAEGFATAHTRAWAAEPHFLLVRVEAERAVVRPVTSVRNGDLVDLRPHDPGGRPVPTPFVISAA